MITSSKFCKILFSNFGSLTSLVSHWSTGFESLWWFFELCHGFQECSELFYPLRHRLYTSFHNSHDTSIIPSVNHQRTNFSLGGMTQSGGIWFDRAVRDFPGAAYTVFGISTILRVAHCPPITVSPFLFALSVSNFKQTLWRCGHLWQYVRMDSWGMRLHQDFNAMGDTTKPLCAFLLPACKMQLSFY